MNWYLQSNSSSNVASSTKIRFARNLSEFKFNLRNKNDIERLNNKVKENVYNIGYGLKFLELKDMDNITKMSLVEKGLISLEFVRRAANTGSILINEEENICIMIGGEEHLELQVFGAGLDIENTLNLAIELDEKIGEALGYAVSKKYGYLTSNLSDIGTGLKITVTLHLPALTKASNLRQVLSTIVDFGVNVEEPKRQTGDMYKISNKQTLGISESETIIEKEKEGRKLLAQNEGINLTDMIYRDYGILSNCRKISNEEARDLLSNIKLGVDLGILDELTDLKVKKLFLYSKPANLQKYLGEQYDKEELEIKRAEMIKQIIKEG